MPFSIAQRSRVVASTTGNPSITLPRHAPPPPPATVPILPSPTRAPVVQSAPQPVVVSPGLPQPSLVAASGGTATAAVGPLPPGDVVVRASPPALDTAGAEQTAPSPFTSAGARLGVSTGQDGASEGASYTSPGFAPALTTAPAAPLVPATSAALTPSFKLPKNTGTVVGAIIVTGLVVAIVYSHQKQQKKGRR